MQSLPLPYNSPSSSFEDGLLENDTPDAVGREESGAELFVGCQVEALCIELPVAVDESEEESKVSLKILAVKR